MSKLTVKRQQFSMDFKLQLLKEYYESGSSMYKISKRICNLLCTSMF